MEEERKVYVLVQEGGSSMELYLHAHTTREEAEADRLECGTNGAYRTGPIVEVPASLADHPGFYDAVEAIMATLWELDCRETDDESDPD